MHYIEKCRYCDCTIGQCRCPGTKETRYSTCKNCVDKEKQSENTITASVGPRKMVFGDVVGGSIQKSIPIKK